MNPFYDEDGITREGCVRAIALGIASVTGEAWEFYTCEATAGVDRLVDELAINPPTRDVADLLWIMRGRKST